MHISFTADKMYGNMFSALIDLHHLLFFSVLNAFSYHIFDKWGYCFCKIILTVTNSCDIV